ncbi:MAG TPA: sugar transferase [Draconibacterium sp.]|nr:sugar transferase [Draconibacterium sp.]
MFKNREYTLEKIGIIFQVMLSLVCFIAVWRIRTVPYNIQTESMNELILPLIMITFIWYLLLWQFGLGKIILTRNNSQFISYLKIMVIGVWILFVFNLIFHYPTLEKENLFLFGALNLFVLVGFKKSIYTVMRFFKRRGNSIRQILVIADEGSSECIEKIIHTKDWLYNIKGIMTSCGNTEAKYKKQFTIISENRKLEEVLIQETIDEVIYCKTDNNKNEISRFISECAEVGISFHHYIGNITKENERRAGKPGFSDFESVPFITYKNTPDNYTGLKLKSAFDFFFSFAVIILISPVFLIIAVAIKLEDGGSVFFKQERVGLNGRSFPIFKFRTMVANAEALQASLMGLNEQNGPVFKITADPRVTRVGWFLRKTSFDELPQFFNVLRGEMSVVGPRPPIPSEVESYQRWQKRRLSMKPGITCIWQVSGRNNIPFEEWMKLDMEYIDNWSLSRDMILVLKTVKVMLLGTGK